MSSRKRTQELQRVIAHRIRTLRKAAGLTQEQLSEKADIAPQYLSRLETARQLPSLDTIVDLADALNVSPSAFLTELRRSDQSERADRIAATLDTLPEEEAAFLEAQVVVWMSHLKNIFCEPSGD